MRLWLRLLRTSRAIENELRERFRTRFDTTLPRFDVMAALWRRPDGMMMSELSRMLLVSNGNVTGIVERLTGEGLVERKAREDDRRASIVKLTRRGWSAFETMASAHAAWIDEMLGGMDPADAQIVTAVLANAAREGEDQQ